MFPRLAIALEPGYQAKRIGSEEEREENDQIRPSNLQAQNARCQLQGLKLIDKLEDSADEDADASPSSPFNGAEISIVGISGKKGKGDVNEWLQATVRVPESESMSEITVRYRVYVGSLIVVLLIATVQILPEESISGSPTLYLSCESNWRTKLGISLTVIPFRLMDLVVLCLKWRSPLMATSLSQKGYDFTMPPEARAYHHLRTIQGIHIPVYIESANLLLPFHQSSADPCAFFFRVWPACLCSEWSTTKKTNRVSYWRLIKPWGPFIDSGSFAVTRGTVTS